MNEYENNRLMAEELARIDFAVEIAEKAQTGITLTAEQARMLLNSVAYWVACCAELQRIAGIVADAAIFPAGSCYVCSVCGALSSKKDTIEHDEDCEVKLAGGRK